MVTSILRLRCRPCPDAAAGAGTRASQASRCWRRYAAAPSAAAVHRQKTPNPCQGVSRSWGPWWAWAIRWPASEGSQACTCLPKLPGSSWASGARTRTNPITPVIPAAVCRTRPPMASANRPSTARYSPLPITARSTPGSPSATGAFPCRMAAPMKNDGNATSSPTTKTSTAKTTDLAASIGTRCGTASRLARIMPVAYSLAITRTPRTQIASWLSWKPEPRIVLTGSAMSWRCWLGSALLHCDTVSQVSSAVKPRVSTTSSPSEATVERTERIFVHSDSSSRPAGPGVVLDAVARQLHECLLQRGELRGQFVQDEALTRRQLADPGCRQSTDGQRLAVVGLDQAALGGDQLREPGRVRRLHQHRPLGAAGDELVGGTVGDQPPAADHDQVLGGDRHLVHQVAGDEDGPALPGQVLHQVPDPDDPLRV